GMDFQCQHDIPAQARPEDWQTLLTRQARILEGMLHRVAKAVTTVTSRPDRTPEEVQRLHHLLRHAEQFLTTMAEQNGGLEREPAYFQEVNQAPGAASPETMRQLHVIDHVTAALHANFTAARQYLADLRRAIEPSGEVCTVGIVV